MTYMNASLQLNGQLQIPTVFRELLKKRGIEGDEALTRFLYPSLNDLPKPEAMQNLVEAARLVVEFIVAEKQIIIWGDYDVDGTTGTALLVNFFRECGVAVSWHIPNRIHEGYGLNIKWFQHNRPCSDFLLITVDCGISNAHEIEQVKKMGGMVIVTDHHSLPEHSLPQCFILNPSQSTCGFHYEQLAGVGVAFYLAAGIKRELSIIKAYTHIVEKINLKQFLAFVALGTLADVVDLTTTNRILVRAGMEALSSTAFPGLLELLASCDIYEGNIVSEDIGFLIGPKINAAGRLGESNLVVALLTADNRVAAKKLAKQLTAFNEERKRISADNLETTLTKIRSSIIHVNKCIIARGLMHQGVVGIVASKLVDIYGFPAVVFAEKILPDNSIEYIGSARSIEGINITEMLQACSDLLQRFGGHEMAAGLSLSKNNFEDFSVRFSAIARDNWGKRIVTLKKGYDIECAVETLMSEEYLDFLQLFEPFGPGNLQPVFLDNQTKIVDVRAVGKNAEHLQLTIRGKYSNLKGIGFNLGNRKNDIQKTPVRKMSYSPTINRFRGNVNWQVRVIDL